MEKIILVTGASSGFGKETVKKLLKHGHTVYATARRLEPMADLKENGAYIFKMDVTIPSEISAVVSQIIKNHHRIDVLVNNAGYGGYGMLEAVSIEEAKKQFDVNVFGLASVTKAVLPYMRKQRSGRIINLSSMVGRVSFPMIGWYGASKQAVESLSDSLRREVKSFGISVSIIEPGAMATEFLDVSLKQIATVNHPEEYQKNVDNFVKVFKDKYTKAPGPYMVANAVLNAVDSSRPKIRYAVGNDCKLAIAINKILPTGIMDYVTREIFSIR